MTTVEFGNGTKLPYLACYEAQGIFDGIERKTLKFEVLRDEVELGTLDALLNNSANLEKVILKNEGSADEAPVEYEYDNYICYMELAVIRSGSEAKEELISFTLGQQAQVEIENMKFKAEIAQMQKVLKK